MILEASGAVASSNINESAAASTEIVAAPGAGFALRVLSLNILCADAVDVTFEDESGADHIGLQSFPANGGIVLPHNPCGWATLAANKALHMLLGSAVQVGGSVTYQTILSS
jgi:hypothetical protein